MAVLVILYIPLVWIGLAIGAKRLHDRDKSAWWLVVFYAIPTILSAAADQTEDLTLVILHLMSFAISVWAFVELGCLRGTIGPNQYGPDPLEPAALGRRHPGARVDAGRAAPGKAAHEFAVADPVALARDLLRCPR